MAGQVTGHSNRLYSPNVIAAEGLYRLMYELVMPRLSSNHYGKYFSNNIGQTITVKRPYYTRVHKGRVKTATERMIDRTVEIKVDKRYHTGLLYDDEERTFDIRDFGDRYMRAGVSELATCYDEDGLEELCSAGFKHVGTPGTALGPKATKLIRARADKTAIPNNSMNFGIIDPLDLAEFGDELKTYNMPGTVKTALQRRYMGSMSDFSVFTSANLPIYEVHSAVGTPLINGAAQSGGTLTTDGWTNDKPVLNKGNIITIAGVNETKPIGGRGGGRGKTGYKAQFVVTADVTASATGTATIPIYPELNDGTLTSTDGNGDSISLAAFQNVDAKPADNAAITILGTAGTDYRQSVWFEQNALEYVPVRLVLPDSAAWKGVATEEQTGLTITILKDFDFGKVEEDTRMDTMYGVKATYPELAVRSITGSV